MCDFTAVEILVNKLQEQMQMILFGTKIDFKTRETLKINHLDDFFSLMMGKNFRLSKTVDKEEKLKVFKQSEKLIRYGGNKK